MFRPFLVSVLIAALSACATLPTDQPVTDESHQRWSQRQQSLQGIDNWSIRGRVALYVNDDVYNLGLGWNRQMNNSTIKLEASLGQGVVQLTKNNSNVTLTTSEGDTYVGTNAEQVLYQSTGWSIPVEGLESWIRGINHTRSDYLPDIDYQGRATSLQQDNWKINFLEYQETPLEQFNNPVLPRKIYMKHRNLALKIVVDQWQAARHIPGSELFPAFPD